MDGRRVVGRPRSERYGGLSVVVAGLQDHDVFALDEVHEAVRLIDSARPCAGERMT